MKKELAMMMFDVAINEEGVEVKPVSSLAEDVEKETWRRLEEEEVELEEDTERLMRASFEAMKELKDYPAFSFGGNIYLKSSDLEELGKEVRQSMDTSLHRRLLRQGLFRVTDLELGLFVVFHEIEHTGQSEQHIQIDKARAYEMAYDDLEDAEQEELENYLESLTIEGLESLFRQGEEIANQVLRKFVVEAERILHEEMDIETEADGTGAEMVFAFRKVLSELAEGDIQEIRDYFNNTKEVF